MEHEEHFYGALYSGLCTFFETLSAVLMPVIDSAIGHTRT